MTIETKTRVLIVFCHPSPESFNASVKDAVLEAIDQAGPRSESTTSMRAISTW